MTATEATEPANGALSASSIFIASITASVWPSATGDPAETFTAKTVPGIGATMEPSWAWIGGRRPERVRTDELVGLAEVRREHPVRLDQDMAHLHQTVDLECQPGTGSAQRPHGDVTATDLHEPALRMDDQQP